MIPFTGSLCQGNQIPQNCSIYSCQSHVHWPEAGNQRECSCLDGIVTSKRNTPVLWQIPHLCQCTGYVERKGLLGTGTMHLCKSKMSDDTKLRNHGRDTPEMIARKPSEVAGTKWQDSKAVLVASSVHRVVHHDSCMRWSSKDRCHVTVHKPVTEYNKNMGGVDLRPHDQILPNVRPHKKMYHPYGRAFVWPACHEHLDRVQVRPPSLWASREWEDAAFSLQAAAGCRNDCSSWQGSEW